MKKFISLIICISMLIGLTSSIFGATVSNDALDSDLNLSRSLDAISTILVKSKTGAINDHKSTVVANVSIENNTPDGFALEIASEKGGILEPASTDDGERDIPYGLAFAFSGSDQNTTDFSYTSSVISGALIAATKVHVIEMTADRAGDPTNVSIEISVDADNAYSSDFKMSGDHSDTLTLTYTDN